MMQKQKYYALQALVCEELPFLVDTTFPAGYGQQYASASTRLPHVKQGKAAFPPVLSISLHLHLSS